MTAFQAQAKMHPCIASLHAILADVRVGAGNFDLIKMSTFVSHGSSS